MSSVPRLSVRKIAEELKLGKSTVAYALRNHPSICLRTRKRVWETARKMGYQPSSVISQVMSRIRGHTQNALGTIAYIEALQPATPRLARLMEEETIVSAQRSVEEAGFAFERISLSTPGMTARRLNTILQARGVSGVIISRLPEFPGKLSLEWQKFSSVAIGFSLVEPSLNRVSFNHTSGILLLVRRCRELGYGRIGLAVTEDSSRRTDNAWLAQFLYFAHQCTKKEKMPAPLVLKNLTDEGRSQFDRWSLREQPDIVLGPDIAFEWLRARDAAFRDHIGFASLDWSPENRSLSGLDQQRGKIGALAGEMVIRSASQNETGIPRYPSVTLIEGRWHCGTTTRPPACIERTIVAPSGSSNPVTI